MGMVEPPPSRFQLGRRLHKREYRDPHPRGPFRSSYKPLIICKKLDTCPRLLVLCGYKAVYKLGTVGTPPALDSGPHAFAGMMRTVTPSRARRRSSSGTGSRRAAEFGVMIDYILWGLMVRHKVQRKKILTWLFIQTERKIRIFRDKGLIIFYTLFQKRRTQESFLCTAWW